MTSNEAVDSPVLSTCLSAAGLVLETVYTKSMPLRIELIERRKHHMQVMKASLASYWSCKPNSFRGSTGLSRGPIFTKYEGPNMGYRVQVALADVIIINKTDLVNAKELDQVKSSIRTDLDSILDLNAYDGKSKTSLEELFQERGFEKENVHKIDQLNISNFKSDLVANLAVRSKDLDIYDLVARLAATILNAALGLISVAGDDRPLVVQAVHELYDSFFTSKWEEEDQRINRLVFIGRNLERASLESRLALRGPANQSS
uniref:COBW domain-containing protein 5 n=1 Tax=Magallana gigas TaxID=29159 RepID=K1R3D2_MAGGI